MTAPALPSPARQVAGPALPSRHLPMPTLRQQLKHLAFRLMRPGLADVVARLDAIEKTVSARRAPPAPATLDHSKYRDELGYWAKVARGEDPAFPGEFHAVFSDWQRTRLRELADQLGLDGPGFAAWARQRTAVEIGGGPHPCVCEAPWKRAIAVDPLAAGYAEHGLYPESARAVVHLASPGESIPLPSAIADLVIIENALDHVDEPAAVAGEMARLLKPGGLAWVLVDLMDYRDHLHPSPMSEAKLRQLMTASGFRERYLASWEGASHPMATHQCRSLWTRR